MSLKSKEINRNTETKNRRRFFISLQKAVQLLQNRKETYEPEFRRHRGDPFVRVGYALLCFGVFVLALSIICNSSVLSFIGLGLTLWGGLFLFIKPDKYVKVDLLNSTVISSLIAIDKILTELNYQGQGIYLPPRRLKELKEGIVLVPIKKENVTPQISHVAQGEAFINPYGIHLTPTGQGLLALYEKKLGIDLSKVNLNYLRINLPRLLVEDLEILEDLEIDEHNDIVHVKINGLIYKDLCSQLKNQTDICSRLGCPLCSSIACALAKATGKAVVIERNELSTDGKTIETWYRLLED